MTLKREIKDAYIEGGNSIYVKTHSNAVYVDDNETETLTQRLDNLKGKIDNNTSQLNDLTNTTNNIKNKYVSYNNEEISYYVSNVGNEENDGLSIATPCKTIQHIIDLLPRYLNKNIYIYVLDNINSNIIIDGFIGNATLIIISNNDDKRYINGDIQVTNCSCFITLKSLHVNNHTITIAGSTNIELNNMHIDGENTDDGVTIKQSICAIRNSEIWNKSSYAVSCARSMVYLDKIKGDQNGTGILATEGAVVGKYEVTMVATTEQITMSGGVIN